MVWVNRENFTLHKMCLFKLNHIFLTLTKVFSCLKLTTHGTHGEKTFICHYPPQPHLVTSFTLIYAFHLKNMLQNNKIVYVHYKNLIVCVGF